MADRLMRGGAVATIATGQAGKASTLRRSQRVCVSVVVEVSAGNGAEAKRERTSTLIVSAHGALLRLQLAVKEGEKLHLKSVVTGKEIECRVVAVNAVSGEERTVGIEFLEPHRNFWHVAFPPVDWSPHGEESKVHGPQVIAKIANEAAARKQK